MEAPEAIREKIKALPDAPGAYLFKDAAGTEIYVGKAKSLRKRVRQYFDASRVHDAKTSLLLAAVADLDYIECRSEVEAFLVENQLIKDLQPKYNVRLKSSATYPYVEITWGEAYPRVLVTRDRSRKESQFIGPFVSASGLRASLRVLQRVFKFCTCSANLRAKDKGRMRSRPCLLYHIGRCRGAFAGRISTEEYAADLRRLALFLGGRGGELEKTLRDEMVAAAKDMRFEEAAALRDTIQALASLKQRGSMRDAIAPGVLHADPVEGLKQLGKTLGLPQAPRTVEGIDIAHLHGQEAVGSLVQFVDGLPSKAAYRRYRIEAAPGGDDFASVREVVTRRYGRLVREGTPLPDIVLIDGGAGQLVAAQGALRNAGIAVPFLASLSKKEELIHTLDHPEGIRLPRRSPALQVLQYVRDEAHRFAQHYHHILRRKRVLEE